MSIMSEYSFVTCVVRYARYTYAIAAAIFGARRERKNKNARILSAQFIPNMQKYTFSETNVARCSNNRKKFRRNKKEDCWKAGSTLRREWQRRRFVLNMLLALKSVILIRVLVKRYVYNFPVTNGDMLMHSYIHYRHSETSDLFLCRCAAELGQSVIQQGEHTEESDINRITLKATPGNANRFRFYRDRRTIS